MKKIEAVILAKHEQNVVDALRKLDLGGMSLFHGLGRGRGPREIKPGLGRYIERYKKIFISTIDKVIDITTKEKVEKNI
jgi:nitrogen regulatory protein P-II 1